jgi:hypothetical protein
VVWKNNFDFQNQAVASINSSSMEIKHLLSWTWAQCASNQQTSIAILIKGKLKLKKFQAHGGPLGSTSSQASILWTQVSESNQCGAGSFALAN